MEWAPEIDTVPMRILIVHNRYRAPGGEDVVVANESALLCDHGHDVDVATVSSEDVGGLTAKVRIALSAPYSTWGRRWLEERIRRFRPDVVHIHNYYPLLSPSVFDACRALAVPAVHTLHNYRLMCPNGQLLRRGEVCEDCVGRSSYRAAWYGCHRGSRLETLPRVLLVERHKRAGTWLRKVDRFITMTKFGKSRFVRAGLAADLIVIKPHFISDIEVGCAGEARRGGVFVGRLSPEKGLATLLRAWDGITTPLTVVGEGPLMPMVKAATNRAIVPVGRKSGQDVHGEMQRAGFVVVPSEWYETFGLVVIEAFRAARPVLVSRIGALAELVEEGVVGLHFEPGNAEDLRAKVEWAIAHPEEMRAMGGRARRLYESRYTPEANYPQLIRIYEGAIADAAARR